MVKVTIPRGLLLNVNLMGVDLIVPPVDIELLDTDWIIRGVEGLFTSTEDIWKKGDANRDKIIDDKDVAILQAAIYSKKGEARYNADADFNSDGKVDGADHATLMFNFGLDKRGGTVTQLISSVTASAIKPLMTAIPNEVIGVVNTILQSQIDDYYKRHPEEAA